MLNVISSISEHPQQSVVKNGVRQSLLSHVLALVLALVCLPVAGVSQAKTADATLLPVKVHGLWGYIDCRGRLVIKPQFAVAGDFSEGRAAVRNDNGWFYYIDETGRTITGSRQYRFAEQFSEGLAAVQGERDYEKIGFIDRTGRIVIAPQFDSFTGKIVGDFEGGLAFVQLNDKIGFIDRNGKFVIEPKFDSDGVLNATSFSDGLAVIRTNGKYGYIDVTGTVRIPAQSEIANRFTEGLAGFSFDREKFGFINRTGKVEIEPQFDWVGSFSEGLATVNVGMAWHGHQKSGGKWGYIDKSGRIIIDVQYEVANSFSEGLAPVRIKGQWGFIDAKGRIRIKPRFDWAEAYVHGVARVTLRDKIGYINKVGKYIWPPTN